MADELDRPHDVDAYFERLLAAVEDGAARSTIEGKRQEISEIIRSAYADGLEAGVRMGTLTAPVRL